MDEQDFTLSFTTPSAPDEVFAAIVDVRSWWTGQVDGPTDRVGAEFTYQYDDLHRSTQRVDELTPGERIAWHVTDAELSFTADAHEWDDTDIVFTLEPVASGTQVTFRHRGLRPALECFEQCSAAWTYYVAAGLRDRIAA